MIPESISAAALRGKVTGKPAVQSQYPMLRKTTREAVDRTLVLGVLAFRSRFEGVCLLEEGGSLETAMAMASGVTEWLRDAALCDAAFGEERAALEQPELSWPGELTIALQSAGLEESVAALLFCVGAIEELPRYDEAVDADAVLHCLPFLSDSPFVTREGMSAREEYASMIGSVTLRSRDAIEAEERRAGAYWWRARSHSLVGAGRIDRHELNATLLAGAAATRALAIPADERGEFLCGDVRYGELDDGTLRSCSRIAEARLRALRWILSDSTWKNVSMDS